MAVVQLFQELVASESQMPAPKRFVAVGSTDPAEIGYQMLTLRTDDKVDAKPP